MGKVPYYIACLYSRMSYSSCVYHDGWVVQLDWYTVYGMGRIYVAWHDTCTTTGRVARHRKEELADIWSDAHRFVGTTLGREVKKDPAGSRGGIPTRY